MNQLQQFFSMVGYLLGWGALVGGFALFIAYQEAITQLSKGLIFTMTLGILVFGIGIILTKSYKANKKREQDRGGGDGYVRITPMVTFTHDLISLSTFAVIILFSQLFQETFSSTDIIKATIAGGGVHSLKWIYKDSYRT